MTFGSLFLFIAAVAFSISRAWGVHPNIFIPVSNATCQSEYTWMNNAEDRSPCLAVAYVIAACAGDTWTQPALPTGQSYSPPNGTTATACYCSWSCYNLMMACTICQNSTYANNMWTWPSFSQNCPANYKDTMFPQGYVMTDNTSIPYWATTNPMTWTAELFDVGQAETYASQNQPDYWPSMSSPNSSSLNIGAIIGGAVGGTVVLFLVLIWAYFLYKRRKYWRLYDADGGRQIQDAKTHAHRPSDPFTILPPLPPGSPALSYMTAQPQGMGGGMNTYPPSFHSSLQTFPLSSETASFLTTGNAMGRPTNTIPII